jgi:hypothetical protein
MNDCPEDTIYQSKTDRALDPIEVNLSGGLHKKLETGPLFAGYNGQ